jgi:hypothetical protein
MNNVNILISQNADKAHNFWKKKHPIPNEFRQVAREVVHRRGSTGDIHVIQAASQSI